MLPPIVCQAIVMSILDLDENTEKKKKITFVVLDFPCVPIVGFRFPFFKLW